MKSALLIASILLLCTACVPPPKGDNDTVANTTANYDFKGNLYHHNADDCWYRCFWR